MNKRQIPKFNKERAKLQNSGTLPPVETNTDWAIKQGMNLIPDAGPSQMDADTYLRLHGTTNAGAGLNYQKPSTFVGPYTRLGVPKYREPSTNNPMFDDFGIPITMKSTNVQRFEPGETVKYNLGKNNTLDEYADYGVNVIAGDEYDKKRAQAQGTGEQIWRGLANAAGGILFGVIENAGYIGGALFDSDYDYDNWLTDIAKRGKDWWTESVIGNVYRENPNATFDLGDPAWWIEHGSGLIESVGEFAFTGGVVGGALAKAAKVSNAIMSAKNANRVLSGAKLATSSLLAYTEGAMTGAEVYNNSYDKLRRQGVSHLDAVRRASAGAATAVQLNTAINTLLNTSSVEAFFGNKKPMMATTLDASGKKITMSADDALKKAVNMGDPNLAKQALNNIEGGKYTWRDMFKDAVKREAPKEAAEEVVNTWAEKSGERRAMEQLQPHLANKAMGISSILDKLTELVNLPGDAFTQEGLLAAVLGATGGIGQTVVTESVPMHKDYEVLKEDQVLDDGRVIKAGEYKLDKDGKMIPKKGMFGRVSGIELENRRQQQEFNRKKALILDDITDVIDTLDKVNSIRQDTKLNEAQKQSQIDDLHNKLFSSEIRRSVMAGTADNLMATYQFLEKVDNTIPVGMKPEVVAKIKELEQSIATKTKANPNADVKAEQEQIDKLKQLSSTETDAMRRGLAKDMNDNAYKEKAKQAQEQIKEYKKLYEELSAKFDYGDNDSKHHMTALYNLSTMKNYRERMLKYYRENLDKASKQVLEDLDKNESAANPKVKEAFMLNEEIKALNKQIEYIQQTTHDLNELITKGDMDAVVEYLSKLYPDVYNNLAADKTNTKAKIAMGLVEEYAKKRNESVSAINNNIKNLSTKRNNAFNEAFTIITGQEGILDPEANYSPDEFDSKLSNYIGDIAQNTRDSIKDNYEQIKKLEEEIATADKALAELKSTKGRDKFIKAVKKYQTALFKELEDQNKEEDKAKEETKKKDSSKSKSSTTNTNNSDPNGEKIDDVVDLTIDPAQLVNTGNVDISKPFSWEDAVQLPFANDSEDNNRLRAILLNLNATGVLPETPVKLENKPSALWSGMYDNARNMIIVNVAKTVKHRYLYTLLHESIHAGFANRVKGGDIISFTNDINNYLDLVVETITGKKGTLNDLVAHLTSEIDSATNPTRAEMLKVVRARIATLANIKDKRTRAEEVIAYAFSSPEVANYLSEHKITSKYDNKKRSLWRVLMEYVMEILNIEGTLLGELIGITNKYMGVVEYSEGMQFVDNTGKIITIQDKQVNNNIEEFLLDNGTVITHDDLVISVATGELSTKTYYDYMVQVRAIELLEKELKGAVTDTRLEEINDILNKVNIAIGDIKLEKILNSRLSAIKLIVANKSLLFKINNPDAIIAKYSNSKKTPNDVNELKGTNGIYLTMIINGQMDIEIVLNYIEKLVGIIDGNNLAVVQEFITTLNNSMSTLVSKKIANDVNNTNSADEIINKLTNLISKINYLLDQYDKNNASSVPIGSAFRLNSEDAQNRIFYEIANKLNRVHSVKNIYAQAKKDYSKPLEWQRDEMKTIYQVNTKEVDGETKYILTPFNRSLDVIELSLEDYTSSYHEINSAKSLSRSKRSELYTPEYIFTNMIHAGVSDRHLSEHIKKMLLNSAKLAQESIISDNSTKNIINTVSVLESILKGHVDNMKPDDSRVLFEKINELITNLRKTTTKTPVSDIIAIYSAFEEYLLGNTSTPAPEFTFTGTKKIMANTVHAELLEVVKSGVDVNTLPQRIRLTRRIAVDQNRKLHDNNGPTYTQAQLLLPNGSHLTFLPEQLERVKKGQPAIAFKRYLDVDVLLEVQVKPGMWIPLQPRGVRNIVKITPSTKPDGSVVYTETMMNPHTLYQEYVNAKTQDEKDAIMTELNTYFSLDGADLTLDEFEEIANNFKEADNMWSSFMSQENLELLDNNPGSDVIYDNEHFYDISFGGGSLNFERGVSNKLTDVLDELKLNNPDSPHNLDSNTSFVIMTVDKINAGDGGLDLTSATTHYVVEEDGRISEQPTPSNELNKEINDYMNKMATRDKQINRQFVIVRDLAGNLRHINLVTASTASADITDAGNKLVAELAQYAQEIKDLNEEIRTGDNATKLNKIEEIKQIHKIIGDLLTKHNLYIPVPPKDNLTSISVDFGVNAQVDIAKYDTAATDKNPLQLIIKTKRGQDKKVTSVPISLESLIGVDGQPLSLELFLKNIDAVKVTKALDDKTGYTLTMRDSVPKGLILKDGKLLDTYEVRLQIPVFTNNSIKMVPVSNKLENGTIQKFTLSPSNIGKGEYVVVKKMKVNASLELQPGTIIQVTDVKRVNNGGHSVKFVIQLEDGSFDVVENKMGRAAFSTFVAKTIQESEPASKPTYQPLAKYIGVEYNAGDFIKVIELVKEQMVGTYTTTPESQQLLANYSSLVNDLFIAFQNNDVDYINDVIAKSKPITTLPKYTGVEHNPEDFIKLIELARDRVKAMLNNVPIPMPSYEERDLAARYGNLLDLLTTAFETGDVEFVHDLISKSKPAINNLDRIDNPVVYKFGTYKGASGITTDGKLINWDKNAFIKYNTGKHFVRINKDGKELAVYINADVLDIALRNNSFMALAVEIPVDLTYGELELVYKALEESFEEMINSNDTRILTKKPSGASYISASSFLPTQRDIVNDAEAVKEIIYKNINKHKTGVSTTSKGSTLDPTKPISVDDSDSIAGTGIDIMGTSITKSSPTTFKTSTDPAFKYVKLQDGTLAVYPVSVERVAGTRGAYASIFDIAGNYDKANMVVIPAIFDEQGVLRTPGKIYIPSAPSAPSIPSTSVQVDYIQEVYDVLKPIDDSGDIVDDNILIQTLNSLNETTREALADLIGATLDANKEFEAGFDTAPLTLNADYSSIDTFRDTLPKPEIAYNYATITSNAMFRSISKSEGCK